MKVAAGTIKELGDSLEESVTIIRSAFGKVAAELGITPENAPLFPAFITLGQAQRDAYQVRQVLRDVSQRQAGGRGCGGKARYRRLLSGV